MARLLRHALPPDIDVRSVTASRGAPMLTTDQDLALARAEVIAMGCALAHQVAAIVVGAFGDPGLAELRRMVQVPAVGIGEASLREAAAGGRRFGVATTTPGLQSSIAHAVHGLGLAPVFTGTRIAEGDPLLLAADPALQESRLADAVRACLDDGAQAVVIGGGPLSEAADRLAPAFDVPVISAIRAAGLEIRRCLAR